MTLETFERTLRRETHVLRKRPGLLVQQLYNRLQWESEMIRLPTIGTADERRRLGAWLRMRSVFGEDARFLQTFEGHRRPLAAVDVDPSGTFVATADEGGFVVVWNVSSGIEQSRWMAATSLLAACRFATQRRLLTAAHDGSVSIWDLNGRLLTSLAGHCGAAVACAVGPGGRRAVTIGDDAMVKIWDLVTGTLVTEVHGGLPAASCAFAPDGRRVATAGLDGVIRVWDAERGAEQVALHGHKGPSTACAFGPDGLLASSGADGTVRIWHSGRELSVAEGHEGRVLACAFFPDGSSVVSGGDDRTLRVWDAKSGEAVAALRGHGDRVRSCVASPDGKYILSASSDTTARIWARPQREDRSRPGHRGRVTGCAIIPGKGVGASIGEDRALRWWSLARLELLGESEASAPLRACAASADGRVLAVVSAHETVGIWDADAMAMVAEHHWGDPARPRSFRGRCAVSADGQLVAIGEDHTRVLQAATGELVARLRRSQSFGHGVEYTVAPADVAFLASGSLLVADGRNVVLWNLDDNESRMVGQHDEPLQGCAARGGLVASSDETGRVRVWSSPSGHLHLDQTPHAGSARVCALSGDGRLVASGGTDRLIVVLDVASGSEVAALPTLGWVSALDFHPQERMLFAGDEGGALYGIDLIGFSRGG